MRLIRFGEPGAEKPGALLDDQTRLDVSSFVSDYDEEFFGSGGLARLRLWLMNGHVSTRRRVSPEERLGPPSVARASWSVLGSIVATTLLKAACSFLPNQCCSSKPHPHWWGQMMRS